MISWRRALLCVFACLTLTACEEKPKEAGGTCASMGGQPCVCEDGRASCTRVMTFDCICDDPAPQPKGGDCSSQGGQECDCGDGKIVCSDHTGRCPCAGGPEPGPTVLDEPESQPTQ